MIGIKFCGGCHAGYDRKALITKIQAEMPDLHFQNITVDNEFVYALVLCRCCARCASLEPYHIQNPPIFIDHELNEEELQKLYRQLLL